MVIFRQHRGGLAESLETAREFENFDDMKKYIYQIHKGFCQKIGVENAPFEISVMATPDFTNIPLAL